MSIYDPLVHSRTQPVTYLHGEHPAFTVARLYDAGDIVSADRTLWPAVKAGDIIACGTCGDVLPTRGPFGGVRPLPIADSVYLG